LGLPVVSARGRHLPESFQDRGERIAAGPNGLSPAARRQVPTARRSGEFSARDPVEIPAFGGKVKVEFGGSVEMASRPR